MDYDEDFLNLFNEWYPLEYYIFEEPKSLGLDFDDVQLMEIFVPDTKVGPIIHDGKYVGSIRVNPNEVYVKVKGPAGVMRFGYMDFEESVRESIRWNFYEDFGDCLQYLYIDTDDPEPIEDLKRVLNKQYTAIIERYGVCKVTKNIPGCRTDLINR